ncbi:hypothetical protein GTO89_14460 [Heliobacterium gestii]|uniref:Uncharacterized protein n=1 Tax=Heliomicrobium gestii TaxID=2699 RepID=A0A845LLH5_HELGE|nr:hypothetical protein [Heliomicrobium gestii]MBM7867967.1 hypothetical protein [Heliomicrobium gestii]MZP44233.1 hypothetical protein [Heliomicrobium gestii]
MQSFILRLFAIILPVYLFLSALWPGGPGQAYLLAMLAAILVWPFLQQIGPLFRQPAQFEEQAPLLRSLAAENDNPGENNAGASSGKGLIIRLLAVSICLLLLGWWWNMPGYYGLMALFNLILAGYLLSRSHGAGSLRRF